MITGRDLIVYILMNHLENEKVVNDGKFLKSYTVEETAKTLDTGLETVKTWYKLGYLAGFELDSKIYLFPEIPMEENT